MKKLILFAFAAFSVTTGIFAQNNSTLNLKKGQKFFVENKVSTKNSTEMMGQKMEILGDVATTYSIEVKDLVNDNYNLSNMVTAIKMTMSQMGQELNFDSEKKEDLDGPLGSGLKDYIKNPKIVIIDKAGKVIPTSTEKADEANIIAKQFGDFEATGYGTDMAFETLPKNLKAGSTWTSKSENNGITKTTNYTVKAINGNLATISLDGTISTDTRMENQGMEITTKTSGKFSGEEIVDITTGVIQSNTSTVDASGTVGVMGQEFPTTSKITTTTTVKTM